MSRRLKKHLELLKLVQKAKPEHRKILIKTAEKSLILCLCECIDNILRGNVKLGPKKTKELASYAKVLRKIVDRKTNNNTKRKLLIQKGGFLPALLAPIIGLAGSLIGELITKL